MSSMTRTTASLVATACTLTACHPASSEPRGSITATRASAAAANATIDKAVAPPSAESAAQPTEAEPTSNAVQASLSPLFKDPAWHRFRVTWRQLDPLTVSPGNAKRIQVASDCEAALEKLGQSAAAKNLVPGLFDALAQVTTLRINVLQGLKTHLMVMHVAPSPEAIGRANRGEAVEERIDALISLKKRNAVSDAEVELALQSIVSEMLAALLPNPGSRRLAARPFDSVPSPTTAGGGDVDPGAEWIRQRVAEVNRLEPYLKAIVVELER